MRKDYKIEVKEAIWACDDAIFWLDKATRIFNKAQGWGVIDLIGGKTFVTFFKQRQINKAEKAMIKAQKSIDKLKKELSDVTAITDLEFEMGIVLKLADYFFGGAIADLIVLGRIGESKNEIRRAKTEILAIKVDLEDLLK